MSKQILVIDDSVSIRQMMELSLRNAGFTVVLAEDGQHGLDLCRTQTFDLVMTDLNMPRLDGLSFVRAVRQLTEFKQTPVIMLTTEAGEAMKNQGREAGATGWMVKPFDPEKLVGVINKLLA